MGTKSKDFRLYEAAREALMLYLKNPNPTQNQNSAAKVAADIINYYKPRLQAQLIKQETTVKDELDISELLLKLGEQEKPANRPQQDSHQQDLTSRFET